MERPPILEGAAAINEYLLAQYDAGHPDRLALTSVNPALLVHQLLPTLSFSGFGKYRNRAPNLTGVYPFLALITSPYNEVTGVFHTGVVEVGDKMYGIDMNRMRGGWDILRNYYQRHTGMELVPVF